MKNSLILVSILLCSMSAFSQEGPPAARPGKDYRERIESIKIAFISQRLNLSPEEAQKFWPVFNQYTSELKQLRKFNNGNEVPLSATEQLELEQKRIDLKRKYMAPIEKIIGTDRLNILYGLEHEFKQKLMEMRDQKNGRPGTPAGRPAPPSNRP